MLPVARRCSPSWGWSLTGVMNGVAVLGAAGAAYVVGVAFFVTRFALSPVTELVRIR